MRDAIINAALERDPLWLQDTLECLDAIDTLAERPPAHWGKQAAMRTLLDSIQAGVRPRVSSVRGQTDFYGHPLDARGYAIVPVTCRGSYTPPNRFA
jgi:hypothetical protein